MPLVKNDDVTKMEVRPLLVFFLFFRFRFRFRFIRAFVWYDRCETTVKLID